MTIRERFGGAVAGERRDRRKQVRLGVSTDPQAYAEVFRQPDVNKSRVVQNALTLYWREALRRQVEEFCSVPDASDMRDTERATPAQREALDRS